MFSRSSFCAEPFTTPEFQALIPNSFVAEPSRMSMFGKRALVHVRVIMKHASRGNRFLIIHLAVQGLAFISTAEIENEELFLNYRYNPNNQLPDWYTPVDIESDREMWK